MSKERNLTMISDPIKARDEFIADYIGTALQDFSLTQRDTDDLDADYDIDDLDIDAREAMESDAKVFWNRNGAYILAREKNNDRGEWTIAQRAASDFWLNRNGHGVGFWSRPDLWGPYTEKFDEDSKWFGRCDLYLGDDGKVYCT
jgi:hypothetical protein